MRRIVTVILLATSIAAAGSHLESGIELQRSGKLIEADRELRAAVNELSASGNQPDLAKALSIESWISVSLGNYHDAIQEATQAVRLRRRLNDEKHVADDLNTLALANQNLGNYGAALEGFEQALRADRDAGDVEGEITRLNNIGNVYYFEGRYVDALRSYQQAKSKVDATLSEPWNPRRMRLTVANIAAVYQIVGKEEMALELYKNLAASSESMPARERAQLLLNQGALYRRLGDPVKALELYKSAQLLYKTDRYSDGEIGVLRNAGTARVMDMTDPEGALTEFSEALRLARVSSNRRLAVQVSLYRSEALRRLHRLQEAAADAEYALQGAKSSGMLEEQWRSLYILGRIAEETGNRDAARNDYVDAVAVIELIRTDLQSASLRSEFLADKRDVYDALIDLRLKSDAPVNEIFQLIERSRARALNERASLTEFQDLRVIQSHLGPGSILLDFWTEADSVAIVWVSPTRSGVVRHAGPVQEAAQKLSAALQTGTNQWRDASGLLGEVLLSGVPLARHLVIVPDGPLSAIPFDVVANPGSKSLLIDVSDISYLPSAQFLVRAEPPHTIRFPWQRELVALGDPPVGNPNPFDQSWQRLQASSAEIRSIADILPGRAEVHVGVDARKDYIEGGRVENLPILHLSTHALVDPENPDRSRILLASDYIFQGEVYGLDLKGIELVTVAACDTARGKTVRGEGVQAFNRAFLAAGANSTVTSLWRVADEPASEFMKQFYYYLSKGQAKSEALRSAKMKFFHSRSDLANPRYWAAFVLTGDGQRPLRMVIPWSLVLLAGSVVFAMIAFAARFAIRAGKRSPRTEAVLTETRQL